MVTGAGGGLGNCVARRLAGEGALLGLTDLAGDTLAATAEEVRRVGGRCVQQVGDAADERTIGDLVAATVAAFGRIDVLCNIAGISPPIPIADMTRASFDRLMHTNCYAQLLAIQRIVPVMVATAGGGAIVNVSSVGALVALPRLTGYGASKAAVIGLTRGVAYEYAEQNIRCNAICPGGIETPMATEVVESFDDREAALERLTGRQLEKRFADPEEVASLIAYLASDEASFMNGAVVPVDGGHTAW